MNNKIQIAVVDDHALFLSGICTLIERISENFEISPFDSTVSFLQQPGNIACYDVVISDLTMKHVNGLALIAALRNRGIKTPVIIISGVVDALHDESFDELEVFDFVHKSADMEKLKSVIFKALHNNPKMVANTKTNQVVNDEDSVLPLTLAPRQLEVLKLVAIGAANREIAEKLEISENTVKSHLKQIFSVLEVKKRTVCITRAQELGLL